MQYRKPSRGQGQLLINTCKASLCFDAVMWCALVGPDTQQPNGWKARACAADEVTATESLSLHIDTIHTAVSHLVWGGVSIGLVEPHFALQTRSISSRQEP